MKKLNLKNILVVSAIAFPLVASAAAGGNSGGGTNAVKTIDDRVISADSLRPGLPGEKCELGDNLVKVLKRAGTLLVRYGADFLPTEENTLKATEVEESTFIENEVLSSKVEYRCVHKIPQYKQCQDTFVARKKDGVTVPLACTSGPITWLNIDLLPHMSLREQTKTLVHERLHTFILPGLDKEVEHAMIAGVTNGLELVLGLYNAQMMGERPILTDKEVKKIEELMTRIPQLNLNANRSSKYISDGKVRTLMDEFKVERNGGGLTLRVPFNNHLFRPDWNGKKFYIGAGSILSGKIRDNAEIIDTSCYDPRPHHDLYCDLDEGSKLYSGFFYSQAPNGSTYLHLHENSKLDRVITQLRDNRGYMTVIEVGNGSLLSHAYFMDLRTVIIGNSTKISNFFAMASREPPIIPSLVIGDSSQIEYNSATDYGVLFLRNNSNWWSSGLPQLVLGSRFDFSALSPKSNYYGSVPVNGQTTYKSMEDFKKALKN